MNCERCQAEEATVVVTTVIDDKKTIQHLCRECAQEAGVDLSEQDTEIKEDAISMLESADTVEKHDEDALRCPSCGLTYGQFKKRYRVGCADCYEAFREQMIPLLDKVHSSDIHTGKRPDGSTPRTAPKENPMWTLEVLRRQLQGAVKREEFEEAARLRDQIAELEQSEIESEEHD